MSKITDMRTRQVIDCADEIGKVINATLGGDFTLNEDGSFELEPWASGLTEVGKSFIGFVGGRRFSNLLSVLAIIMDSHVEIESALKPRKTRAESDWIRMSYQEREQVKQFAGNRKNLSDLLTCIAHWMRQTNPIPFSEYAAQWAAAEQRRDVSAMRAEWPLNGDRAIADNCSDWGTFLRR